jgi:hypothetical protein
MNNLAVFSLVMSLIFSLSLGGFAQVKEKPAEPAKDENFVIWDQRPGACTNSTCTMTYYEGVQYLSIAHHGVTVVVGIEHDNKHYRALVIVRNDALNPVHVVPPQFKIIQTKPVPREYRLTPAADIAKAVKRKAQWSKAFAAFAAGMATTEQTAQTTETGTVQVIGSNGIATGMYQGNTTTTTTRPNTTLQRETARRSEREVTKAEAIAESIEIAELRANTVSPGRTISGDIYFVRDKSGVIMFLQIPIDGFSYNFPIFGPKYKSVHK